MTFKDTSVLAKDIHVSIIEAMMVCETIFSKRKLEMVITSLNDGHHMENSLHYAGKAMDIRIFNIPSVDELKKIVWEIKSSLGSDYDVVLEKDHIHVEFDPKRSKSA